MSLKKLTTKHLNMCLELGLGANRKDVAEKYSIHIETLNRLCATEPLFSDEIERIQTVESERTIAQWRSSVVNPMLKELGSVTDKLIKLAKSAGSEQVQRSAAMDIINTVKAVVTGQDEEGVVVPSIRVEVVEKVEDVKLKLVKGA